VRIKIKKKYVFGVVLAVLIAGLALLIIDLHVAAAAGGLVFDDVASVPAKRAALLLGTSKYSYGRENLFYNYRIDAAHELYEAGKVKAILISGDHSRADYDEPSQMKADLVARGVPSQYITLDYAGLRTLDSIVRARQIFGIEDYIVVSQKFHCERALYIARAKNQRAVAYLARKVEGFSGMKIRLRETLARLKAFLDVRVLGTQPRFLGRREQVVYQD